MSISLNPHDEHRHISEEWEERTSLRRVVGLSTELEDISDAEYRSLRLEKAVLVGVWTEGTSEQAEAAMRELAELTETAGALVADVLIQRRSSPDPSTYIGSGKVSEVKDAVMACGADTVICDGELSAGQLIALEKAINVKVIDRTALILDIFAQHASSSEGKAQVTLAQLEYMLPRLRGWGDTLSRQAGGRAGSNGGVGLRGPGETKIETDRRRIRQRMARLRHDLSEMKAQRSIKRQRRQDRVVPSVVLVGYTNAGKSSLLNRLTGAHVLTHNALFATLDPTTRRLELPDGRIIVMTDTVGFVRYLPTQLVESFRSTLEEVVDADLILHVVDGTTDFPEHHIDSVNQVLEDVAEDYDVDLPPRLVVVNKADCLSAEQVDIFRGIIDNPLFLSAATGSGSEVLLQRIVSFFDEKDMLVTLLIPYAEGDKIARIYERGKVLHQEHTETGTVLRARVPAALAQEMALFSVEV